MLYDLYIFISIIIIFNIHLYIYTYISLTETIVKISLVKLIRYFNRKEQRSLIEISMKKPNLVLKCVEQKT